ncbi:hypothetical protein GYMLUDRAFT_78897 [Collybiopsis luxurians FD-317 M1]|nr:hypothetical protein GYMLUDRAFT_78897 [Collybiopsis luxurians FD-317 M1]
MMDEEDSGPPAATSSYFSTKNEVVNATVTVPDIEEVGPDEQLELVGHVMNIVDNVVIVEGLQTELARVASDRALDADTLLVFEDRKVLGYIFETFGPTTQPMYQVKFNPITYPLNLEKVRISLKVYHVPQRSNFVFMRQIQAMKGSDASNMNDEEPAEHELEFSDDEAEAEHKRNLKKKRTLSRVSSAVPSRQSTPTPSQMRDADMIDENYFMSNNAYDEIGPYDLNYEEPISRPAPVPYDDDPYADEFEGALASSSSKSVAHAPSISAPNNSSALRPQRRSAGRKDDAHGGRGQGRSNNNQRNQNRRGGGRGGRGSFNTSGTNHQQAWSQGPASNSEQPQPQFYQQTSTPPVGQWPFQMQNQGVSDYGAGMYRPAPSQQQFIQPHINPLFANRFRVGMGMGGGVYPSGLPAASVQSQPPQGYPGMYTPAESLSNWSDQWATTEKSQTPEPGS